MYARKRLGELLVEAGAIDEFQLNAALGHQRQWGGRLGRTLVDMKLVAEPTVVSALSRRLDCEVAHLDTLARTKELDEALQLVPAAFARRHLVIPVALKRNEVCIAMADPSNVAAIDELSFRTGRKLKVLLAGEREVARAVKRLYGDGSREDALEVEFDRSSPDDDAPVFEQSAAQYQERFYTWTFRTPTAETPAEKPATAKAQAAPEPPPASDAKRALRALPANGSPPTLPRAASPVASVAAAPVAPLQALAATVPGTQLSSAEPHALSAAVIAVLIQRGLVTESEIRAELARQESSAKA